MLDICKAIEALRRSNYEGNNIGSGKATSLIKIAKFFAKHFNKKIVINNKKYNIFDSQYK